MTDEVKVLCNDILKYYGEEHQKEKLIEEMAELIVAIKHSDEENYVEELADVGVVLEQLYQALPFEKQAEFIKMQNFKVFRQLERIKGEEYKPFDLVEQAFRQGYLQGKKEKENANT